MKPAIKVSNLRYSYGDETLGLKDITFEIAEGELVCFIGANGSGKTTLLLNLMGLLAGAGDIEILGRKMEKNNRREVWRQMGLLFQNPDDLLFSLSVQDDVIFGPLNMGWPRERALQTLAKVLSQVGLDGFQDRSPQRLSFGEKKRVGLACILAMEPQILLLDEPTAGLDPRSSTEFIDLLDDLHHQGKTILIATHDLHLVYEVAQRVIVLGENKKIAAQGDPRQLLQNSELLLKNNLIHQHRHGHRRTTHVHHHYHLGHEHHLEEEEMK
jgi:cobalt/nickel transport system ATP-binding protein